MRQKILDHINKTVEPALVLDQNLTAEAVKNWTLQKEILKSNFSDDFDIRKDIDKRKATIAETLLRPCVGCRFCGVVSDRSFYVTQNTTSQVIHLHPQINPFMFTQEDSFIFSLYLYKGRAQNNESKEHCLCIKENQNKSSQSFLRNPSSLKSPLAHVWLFFQYSSSSMEWPELDYFLRWKEFSDGTTASQLRLSDEPSAHMMSAAEQLFIDSLKRGGKYQV